ncbi:MAG: TerD family protein [Planctomycetota bacterium]|jgi:tellurium resistance protein TerZ|nr:TerD family protein [Planctomycetota bacterium]
MAVSLMKGQRISLAKEGDSQLTQVFMGLGWDAVKKKGGGFLSSLFGGQSGGDIDLDASCIMFDEKKLIDAVWFRQLTSEDGSIRHSGDNLTGEGEGDDETIHVDLAAVPGNVTSLVFVITSFRGQTFNEIQNAFCRLVDARANKEIASYTLSGGGKNTAQIMARVYRHGGEWKMAAIGEPAQGATYKDVIPKILPFL